MRGAEDRRDARVGRVARHPRAVDVVVAQRGRRARRSRARTRPRGAPGAASSPRRRCAGRRARPRRPPPAPAGDRTPGTAARSGPAVQVGGAARGPGGRPRARRSGSGPRRRRPCSRRARRGPRTRRARARAAARPCRGRCGPRSPAMSSRSTPRPTIAAWWQTASTPSSARSTTSGRGRRRTFGASRAPPGATSAPARVPRGSASTMCEPMKPAPPVTRTMAGR